MWCSPACPWAPSMINRKSGPYLVEFVPSWHDPWPALHDGGNSPVPEMLNNTTPPAVIAQCCTRQLSPTGGTMLSHAMVVNPPVSLNRIDGSNNIEHLSVQGLAEYGRRHPHARTRRTLTSACSRCVGGMAVDLRKKGMWRE